MMLNALRQESDADPYSAVISVDLSAETETGHEGIYDQALSNALAVIVAAEWPGEEANRKGRVHSAKGLLEVIAEKIRPNPATACALYPIAIPTPAPGGRRKPACPKASGTPGSTLTS
ncbi:MULTISPECIES: hypothetical protein [unclassified Streptomyces]|uniref:hypothetical protein n=1 Tax=unclassified Streptomyces TaxID=2593676 RepID=UPI002E1183FB|nr:hypothetical protein OG452_32955 [Streptomyces sp. NBC_01197]WSS47493.1 hypothetical protein OG708_01890 [Streptomyces sp. NBC_01180]